MQGLFLLLQLALFLQVGLTTREKQPPPADGSSHSPHGSLKIPCQNCHTAKGWTPIRAIPEFEHKKTGFALRGMHVKVGCADCHTDLVFANVGKQCQDCHADIHRRKNGAQCDMCHRDTGWQVSIHNISEHQDRFPLIGAHAAVDCYSCHKVGTVGPFNRQGLSTECVSCHLDDFRKAKSPNHQAQGFSRDCLECHSLMDNWLSATIRMTRGSKKGP